MPEAIDRGTAHTGNRTVAEQFTAALKRHGVKLLIGQSAPARLFFLAPEHGIRVVGMRTEKAGAMIADGFARISRTIPVVASIAGPGAALLVPGLGEAYKASVPVLAIVQDVPRSQTDKNPAQEFDHFDLFRPCAKMVKRIERADRVEDYLDMAFAVAASGRPGPVVLLVPPDLLEDAATAADRRTASMGTYPIDRTLADPAKIAEAAALLAKAEAPVVVAGGGVHISDAAQELAKLQDAAALPVATSMMGKGAVDETHPLSLGVVGYFMGRRAASRAYKTLLKRADVVLLIGNRTNQNGTDSWTLFSPDARFIHIDVDSLEVGRNYEALRLVGDAKLTIAALTAELAKRDLSKRKSARAALEREIADGRTLHAKEAASVLGSSQKPIRPERVMAELAKVMTPETIVVGDASYATIWVANYLRATKPGARFITPRGLAGIGWGFPLAIGAKLAAPDRPVIYLGGDGAFAHAWAELETARRHKLKLLAIILNNEVLGYEQDYEDAFFGQHSEVCHFTSVDHAAIARACGWTGVRVEDPGALAGALHTALAAPGPTLFDVISDPKAYPPISSFDGRLPDQN
jgi:acetolactate synthase I/II/III large subunit